MLSKVNVFFRLKAMLVHLCISLMAILGIIFFIKLVWFPSVFFDITDAKQGVQILFSVDVVLGPILTFAVCSSAKSRTQLTRDLGIIGILQFVGLAGGIYVLSKTRPLAVVYVYDTFHVIRRSDYGAFGIATDSLSQYPGKSPKMFYVPTADKQSAFLISEVLDKLNKKVPKYYNLDLYRPFPVRVTDRQQVLATGEDETRTDNPSNCLQRRIQSVFYSGKVCFDTDTGQFSELVVD